MLFDDKFETFFIFPLNESLDVKQGELSMGGGAEKGWIRIIILPFRRKQYRTSFSDFYGSPAITFDLIGENVAVEGGRHYAGLFSKLPSLLSLFGSPCLICACLINLSCAEMPECDRSIEKGKYFHI
jgi:hypothetical protein